MNFNVHALLLTLCAVANRNFGNYKTIVMKRWISCFEFGYERSMGTRDYSRLTSSVVTFGDVTVAIAISMVTVTSK